MASAGGSKLSKEEYRREKDLDAARKAGNAPAQKDAITGKDINPHIPEFMAKAPWYLDSGQGPSLVHQKNPAEKHEYGIQNRYERGRVGEASTKYRKGACENCGAATHKTKECLERPRKKGAKWTGRDIKADEYFTMNNNMDDYDSKRDRWDGYDPREHYQVVKRHEMYEEARKRLREEQLDSTSDLKAVQKVAKTKSSKKRKEGKDAPDDDEFGSSGSDSDGDELKYADAADVVGQKMDTKTRMTVRNLRIREDTAKYLINLDPDSAYYDPKTRSMREAPDKSVGPEEAKFAGDNYLRHSGEATEAQNVLLYAWQNEQRGGGVHVNSNPTAAGMAYKDFLDKRENLKDKSSTSMLAKYGGEEYLQKVPKELVSGQDENYVEYSRTGQILKGQERAKAKSKYDEDVFPNNHTSIWGSWFDIDEQKWGYACCHNLIWGSYCVGSLGIKNSVSDPHEKLKNASS